MWSIGRFLDKLTLVQSPALALLRTMPHPHKLIPENSSPKQSLDIATAAQLTLGCILEGVWEILNQEGPISSVPSFFQVRIFRSDASADFLQSWILRERDICS